MLLFNQTYMRNQIQENKNIQREEALWLDDKVLDWWGACTKTRRMITNLNP